ncbi:MAG: outer membrane beta-barrel protein [Bacteroidota bacterium]|nr:outer membrane beta-barrel protein [Bacteroidota bacterium]MDP4232975.1 outer membrane beta-barrel protein [Bacteroidota bacterium]MDP4242019.1 outer membrane beta-barrel protein [Bacteroidota bacterium]MDP4286922.1 outer membrane beta-barrel protein [Bacteroidota bacterium]
MIFRHYAVIAVLLVIAPYASRAQWGVEAGVGYDIQGGTFTAPCACPYSDGSGYAVRGAVSYDVISLFGLSIGVMPGVDYKQFESAHTWTNPNDPSFSIRDSANISQTYITFEPYVRYTIPVVGVFVQAAPSAAYMVSSHFYQRKYNATIDSVWQNGPLENSANMRYSAHISAGYDFALLGLQVAPSITADLPLSQIYSVDAKNVASSYWGITTIYGSLAVRF